MTSAIRIIDDAVPDPLVYRAHALTLPFGDIEAGPITFHNMAPIGANPLSAALEQDLGLHTTFSAFRLSPEGQDEPNFLHTDRDMGDWTGILYLNPEPPNGDGTTFWRHKVSGAIESTAATQSDELLTEWAEWRRLELWEPWQTVAAVFNQLLLFPSPYFHSRAIFENWGRGQDARLVQLCFGTGAL